MSRVKIGDEFIVQLQGIDVAYGQVEYVDGDEVTIIIPQTRVVMGLSSSLAPLEREATVHREMTVLPSDEVTDGGSAAREMVDVAEPQDLGRDNENLYGENKITTSNTSLRDQALDSSVLD